MDRLKINWKIVLIAVLGFVVIFFVQNYHAAKIKILFWSIETSMGIIVFLTLISGMGLGYLISFLKNRDRYL